MDNTEADRECQGNFRKMHVRSLFFILGGLRDGTGAVPYEANDPAGT